MKEGRKKGNSLQQKTNIISVTGWRGGRLRPKKKKISIASFLCFQMSHFKLLTLPVHLSLGKKRIAGFSWRHHGVKQDEHWPGPGNKLLFSSNGTRSPLEGEKEAMQRSDRFPITKNHSFFQRLRDSGAHPFLHFFFTSPFSGLRDGWGGSGLQKGPVNWISRSWYMFSSCRCSRKGRNDVLRAQILASWFKTAQEGLPWKSNG